MMDVNFYAVNDLIKDFMNKAIEPILSTYQKLVFLNLRLIQWSTKQNSRKN